MSQRDDGGLGDILDSVVGKLDIDPVKADAVCQMLVEKTLVVRDQLVAQGDHLTVGETRQAVTLLLLTLDGEPLPHNLPPSVKLLLEQWVEGLQALNQE